MKKLRKEDINQEIFDLYDDYAHDRVSRRLFMDKLATYAVGGLTVASLMSFISPDYVKKIQIRKDDPKLKSEFINYDSPNGGGTIKGLTMSGAIRWKSYYWVYVSAALKGKYVAIEDIGNGIWKVFFRNVFLGFFDQRNLRNKQESTRLETNLV